MTVPLHPLPRPGDDPGWIYDRYYSRVYRFALRRFGPRDAEDIAQETLARCYAHAGRIDLGRDLWPWLCTVAHNVGCDVARGRLRNVAVTDETLDALRTQTERDAADEVVSREECRMLGQALHQLSPSDRLILRMREIDELGFEEIGDFLGLTANNARQRVFRARLRLGKLYGAIDGRVRSVLVGVLAVRGWLRRRTAAAAPRTQELAPLVSSPAVYCLTWAATVAVGAGVLGIGAPGGQPGPGGDGGAGRPGATGTVVAGWAQPGAGRPGDPLDGPRRPARVRAGGPGADRKLVAQAGPATVRSRVRDPRDLDEKGETDRTRVEVDTPLGTLFVETSGKNPSGGPGTICLFTGICPDPGGGPGPR